MTAWLGGKLRIIDHTTTRLGSKEPHLGHRMQTTSPSCYQRCSLMDCHCLCVSWVNLCLLGKLNCPMFKGAIMSDPSLCWEVGEGWGREDLKWWGLVAHK